MAMGMEMMMKSFGFDPDELKKTVADFQKLFVDIRDTLQDINRKQDAIRAEQLEQRALLDAIANKMELPDGTLGRDSKTGGAEQTGGKAAE